MILGQEKNNNDTAPSYEDSYDHLADELRKLDLLIQRRVMTFRLRTQAIKEAARPQPMYISHEEVDWLLSQDASFGGDSPGLRKIRGQLDLFQSEINARVTKSLERGVFLALPHLSHLFGLSYFELQTIIICLAPELYREYDRLYAYLQDDITRKKPSIALVMDLLCDTPADRWKNRTLLSGNAPLFQAGIVHMTDDPQSPSGSSDLARFLKLDPRIGNYLLGHNSIDERLVGLVHLYSPLPAMDHIRVDPAIKTRLLKFTQHHFSEQTTGRKRLVLYFHGPYGAGKRDLALGICGQLSCPLLYVDMALLLGHGPDLETMLPLAFREGLLLQAAIYVDGAGALLKEDEEAKFLAKKLARMVTEYGWLTFLAGERPWSLAGVFEHAVFHDVELSVPDERLREATWENALERFSPAIEQTWFKQLARQFRLTPGQIRDAVEFVNNQCAMNGGQKAITLSDLYAACRHQSNQRLGKLAVKVRPRYRWEDIILPEDALRQLKEICGQVRHRYRVFGEWGFGSKVSHGKGLSILFSGSSGTGKTMAAEIIANELQLVLYKIDLSGVVSKYVGETEKNLHTIFHEGETSNAILFFDEADALFGKRTEISDAHDRYANMEVSYLLQKMEEYEGMVILASNFRQNMDEAFTRRIRFIVEFPFPDAASRRDIWKKHFPPEAPVSDGIDYEFLSKQFQVPGGNIRNIVLNAAFLGAENGGTIGMAHILRSARREFEKIGKLWDEKNFVSANGKGI